jgi:hypothetical protein
MPYTHGFSWGEKPLERLKELTMWGLSVHVIAEKMSKELNHNITYNMVIKQKSIHRILNYLLVKDDTIKIYKELFLPEDNYMWSCDEHAPYHSELWVNRKLAIAEKYKVTNNVQIGDTLDFDFIKKHPLLDGEKRKTLDEEFLEAAPSIKALLYFKKNWLMRGNHEFRVSRYTNSLIQAKHLYKIFGEEKWNASFIYSDYDKLNIGKNWLLLHPKSYSQIQTSVGKRMAEKFHRNIINTHGHTVGSTYDRSGKFLVVDLGCMLDVKKIGYINLQTTTHPTWKNGFGMLLDGHFYHFNDETDWDFWLN